LEENGKTAERKVRKIQVVPTACKECLRDREENRRHIQGGSNMTGTNCDLFTHKSSRSYLNHLVNNSMKTRTNRGRKKECKLEKGDRDRGKNKWMNGLKKD
jgi:hypothetical protein